MIKSLSLPGRIRPEMAVYALVAVIFILYSSIFLSLPGLYMDGINPEYMIPEMLYSEDPIFDKWLLPGNVLNGRFPVFSGPVYHGSLQVYATLPFLFLVGVSLESFRFFQILVTFSAILLAMIVFNRHGRHKTASATVLLMAGLLLVTDPIIAFGVRTQAYSVIFPLPLLFASWILLEKSSEYSSEKRFKQGLLIFVSGLAIALAIFSYFVYVFFVPALLYLLWRKPTGETTLTSSLKDTLIWALGGMVGLLPFFGGVYLFVTSFSRLSTAIQQWQVISTGLNVLAYRQTLAERLGSVLLQVRDVLDGQWVFAMILKERQLFDDLASLKVLIILVLLLYGFWTASPRFRNFVVITFLATLGAAFVFQKLTSHHFIMLLPLFYMGMASGLASTQPQAGARNHRYLIWGLAASVICINLLTGVNFLGRLRATGGAGFFSEAINRFSTTVMTRHPGSMIYLPDWGYRMPFTFLVKGQVEYDATIDPIEIRKNACQGRESFVVFDKADNYGRYRMIEELSGVQGEFSTWVQLDGEPVFQMGYFPAGTDCEMALPDDPEEKQFLVLPEVFYSCRFLAPESFAYVEWDFESQGVDRVRIYTVTYGQRKLWMKSDGAGSGFTPEAVAHEGFSVLFVDDNDGKTLDEFTVETNPCPIPEFEDDGSWAKPRQ